MFHNHSNNGSNSKQQQKQQQQQTTTMGNALASAVSGCIQAAAAISQFVLSFCWELRP
jgi:hypothetical protein